MKLIVNGGAVDFAGAPNLAAFLAETGLSQRTVVVLNDDVVPMDGRSELALSEGDRLELLTFAGGG